MPPRVLSSQSSLSSQSKKTFFPMPAPKKIRSHRRERRLLFVGITRAKDHLQISCAKSRGFGSQGSGVPSSFLMELPRGDMIITDHTENLNEYFDGGSSFGGRTTSVSSISPATTRITKMRSMTLANYHRRTQTTSFKDWQADQTRSQFADDSPSTACETYRCSNPIA